MAISAVTSTANTYANSGGANISMTSPTGTTTGDVLVCLVAEHTSSEGVTKIADTATGTLTFTSLNFGAQQSASSTSVWYRVVQAGDPTSWTVTTTAKSEALLMAYRGVDNTTPIDAQGTTNTSSSSSSATFNAVTTVTANAWYVGVLGASFGTTGPWLTTLTSGSPTPTIRGDAANQGSTPTRADAALIDVALGAAGSSGSFVYSGANTTSWGTFSFALRPAGPFSYSLDFPATTVALPLVSAVFQGYRYYRPLIINGGSAAVSGSLSAPTTSGTDYVVQFRVAQAAAASIWGGLVDKTAFSDMSVWYNNAGTWQQIDIDIDQATNGPWSGANITLWFKLQANLGAAPASDTTNYRLAWGNPSPTAKNNWANIYPFSDNFLGTSLSGSWTSLNASYTVSGGSVVLSQPSGSTTYSALYTTVQYGNSYLASAAGAMNSQDSTGYVEFQLRTGQSNPNSSLSVVQGDSSFEWGQHNSSATLLGNAFLGTLDTNQHVFGVARNASGVMYGFLDNLTTGAISGTGESTALPVNLAVYKRGSFTVDWVKVRPFVSGEPTVAASALVEGALVGNVPRKELAASTTPTSVVAETLARGQALAAQLTPSGAPARAVGSLLVAALAGAGVVAAGKLGGAVGAAVERLRANAFLRM